MTYTVSDDFGATDEGTVIVSVRLEDANVTARTGDDRSARDRRAVASGRARRRNDAARQGALEGGSCGGRCSRGPYSGRDALVSATNGKTTTTAMAAEILGTDTRLAWNRAGANLLSGIASALVAARRAELGLFEVDEDALPRRSLERDRAW